MHCQNCGRTVSQKDSFCRFCGQAAPGAPRPQPLEPGIPRAAGVLAHHESQGDGTWGARVNRSGHEAHRAGGCPGWVAPGDWRRWDHCGLVVWDNAAQRIGALLAGQALELLAALRASPDWQAAGIPIIESSWRIALDDRVAGKPSRKKPASSQQPGPANPPGSQHLEERLRLTGSAATEFRNFLEEHEPELRQLAEEDCQEAEAAFHGAWALMLQNHRTVEARQVDLGARPLPWRQESDPLRFVCDVPPDRVTVSLVMDGWNWEPVIEQPDRFKSEGPTQFALIKALAWAEAELPRRRAEIEKAERRQAAERAEEAARLAALPRLDLRPFWIEPAEVEPQRITYRCVIDLEHTPFSSQVETLSFGKPLHWRKEYYTPTMIMEQIGLSSALVQAGDGLESMGWYRLQSVVTYLQAAQAAAQAQSLWDRSQIVKKFEEGRVLWANYGYVEVETGYPVWLGVCAGQQHSPPEQPARADFMVDLALQETLLRALDVNGWRAYLEMPFKYCSDDALLHAMHKRRAESRYQSAEAREASREWLQAHPS